MPHYRLEEPDIETKFLKSCKALFSNIAIGTAALSKGLASKGKVKQLFNTGLWGTYYLMSKRKRVEQSDFFFSKPDLNTTLTIYNLLERPVLRNAMKVLLPSIKLVKKIYVPMCDSVLTVESLLQISEKFARERESFSGSRQSRQDSVRGGQSRPSKHQAGP